MAKFEVGDKVIYTPVLSFGKGEITYVHNKDKSEEQTYFVTFNKNEIDEIILLAYESRIISKDRVRHVCPECGIDYADEDMERHMLLDHNTYIKKSQSTQAEEELMEMDRIQKLKADKYDEICGMLFIATGVVDDGDSIRYITDPESVCDELLRIIIEDENVNIEKLLDTKKKKFKEITLW